MLASVGGIVGLLAIVVWIYAIIDSLTTPAQRVRLLPKGLWVVIVLLFSFIGSALWFILGKPHRFAAATGGTGQLFGNEDGEGTNPSFTPPTFRLGGRPPSRSVAPDDNPEFLKRINEDLRKRSNDPRDPRDTGDA